LETEARAIVERMALLWQAALFARAPANPAAELFIESRIAGRWGRTLGTLPASSELARIVQRAAPAESVEYIV
jgi:putative acyl-CoA dehydrogenase